VLADASDRLFRKTCEIEHQPARLHELGLFGNISSTQERAIFDPETSLGRSPLTP
jgi:hypothetical protein